MKELIDLFTVFFKMGAFTFGGGYAMLPIIQEEIVDKRQWATNEEVIDYYAIGQCTPGIIAVNTATFIGYKRKGILGGTIATLGLVAPSVLIITVIARFFKHFQDYAPVQHAFAGIQAAVVALIVSAVMKMYKQSVNDGLGIFLFGISFFIIAFFNLSPIIVIILAALVGIIKSRKMNIKGLDLMLYLKLYLVFLKIGLFAVGGGLATLPFLQEIVSKYGWISSEELLNMIAISESTPGPIGINAATFVGHNTAGIFGGVLATLGLITPSIIIIIIIAHYFARFSEEPLVQSAFSGIRPAVAGLIGAAGFEVAKIALFNLEKYGITKNIRDIFQLKGIILFGLTLYLINKYNKHPIIYLLAAAIIGIAFKY